jgi:hypothetical protein
MIILMSFIDVLFGCYYFMLYLCIHVKDVYLFNCWDVYLLGSPRKTVL